MFSDASVRECWLPVPKRCVDCNLVESHDTAPLLNPLFSGICVQMQRGLHGNWTGMHVSFCAFKRISLKSYLAKTCEISSRLGRFPNDGAHHSHAIVACNLIFTH